MRTISYDIYLSFFSSISEKLDKRIAIYLFGHLNGGPLGKLSCFWNQLLLPIPVRTVKRHSAGMRSGQLDRYFLLLEL